MESKVTDFTLRYLTLAEEAARKGAYNLYKYIQILQSNRDIRIIEQAIRWCADEDMKIKQLGSDILDSWDELADEQLLLLVRLTKDKHDETRNWATFFLGTYFEIDNTQVRDVLFLKTSDAHDETRDEALVGLAKRKDPRAFSLIAEELNPDTFSTLTVAAAEELADSRLLHLLVALRECWDGNSNGLEDAIEACGGIRLSELS